MRNSMPVKGFWIGCSAPACWTRPRRPRPAKRGVLLAAALRLRESTLKLLERREGGSTGDPAELNRVLALGSAHHELIWKRGQPPRLRQHLNLSVLAVRLWIGAQLWT
jgi:predicted RNA-binding Zn ribbon-like protein